MTGNTRFGNMRELNILLLALLALLLALASLPAVAEEGTGEPASFGALFETSGSSLLKLFVLAILIENALAVLFNWRLFRAYFNLRGVKTLVMIVISLIAVFSFNLNIVAELLLQYDVDLSPEDSKLASQVLTALILAGGSSGVNDLMVKFGWRDANRAKEKTVTAAPKNQAWIAIRVSRTNAAGPIGVRLSQSSPQPAVLPDALAGTISNRSMAAKDLLLHNKDRFPSSGGYVVTPGKEYSLSLDAVDAAGQSIPCSIDGKYVFADGAIVDLEVDL